MKSMRLLYLMTEPFGVGGVQSDILALSEELGAKGKKHEIFVATTPGVLLDELKQNGVHFIELDFRYKGGAGFFRSCIKLRKIIREHKIDVLAPQSVRTSIVSYMSLRMLPYSYRVPATGKPVPIITTIHNIHNPAHFRYAGRILNRCADYVIFESNYERNRCLASGLPEDKSTVVHSGIDTDRFHPIDPVQDLYEKYGLEQGNHKVFGIVARLSEEKGHDYLLKAFAKVHDKNPDARLLVIGDGPLLEQTKALSSTLNLDNVVTFTGLQRNIPEHLSILDVFVLSSTRESFPLAAREAMAAGKSVIAPRIGGCGEVVADGKTGYLFESRNIDELAEKMNMIISGDKYQQFGRASRLRVEENFSRHQWVSGDERIYLSFT
jgi:glycosyltransferase involved in cell wall biosynthesis